MTIEEEFFISVIRMVDDGLLCSLQTYDDDMIDIIKEIKGPKIYDWADTFILNKSNKNTLIKYIMLNDYSIRHIYYFEIKKDDVIIFVAYDGFEIGTISSSIKLTEKFIDKFVKTNLCGIVDTITSH